ncbi:MAG: glutamyl-tRNA reductase [Candidatus Meridianibacter frigidus]|nr:MAG: glutamyl-tRNA reductase [Candidatus Eremiobacteraeota bacterium]
MPLVCLGLSHHTAPLEVRERHTFPASRMAEALIALRDYEAVKEAAMLSTCGRLEIYAELDDYESGVTQLKAFLENFRHGDVDDLENYLYTLLGRQAVEHLFRVSTGLDSMLIGEAEILGQVKDAYVQAQAAQSLGTTLHKLFREALNAGKLARSQTHIGNESVSIATAAIELARSHIGDLAQRSVVVIGAGKMAKIAARRLREAGATQLYVTNRTIARAQDLVAQIGYGDAIDLPGLGDAVAACDLVVTSTGAPDFVLTKENVAAAMARRPHQPILIIDIAVPRDADPQIAELENVSLVDVDGLRNSVDSTLQSRRAAIPMVEEIIDEYIERFNQWYQGRTAVPVIASLTRKAEAIRQAEMERLFARCPDLSERNRMLVTGMSLKIISRLLHNVVTRIRDKAVTNYDEAQMHARMLDELFDLRIDDAP